MLEIIQAIFLGIIEGLTEFLPISSTGHLIVAENVINYHDAAQIFTVVVQLGAILAIAWHYREDLISKIVGLFKKDPGAITFWRNLVIATIPAGLFGLVLNKPLEKYSVAGVVAVSLFVGGLIILWAEAKFSHAKNDTQVKLENISTKQALGIGFAQVVSLIPGVSRSGATIIGGMVAGLNRTTAVTFSFYMSLPIMVLASGYKLLKDRSEITSVPGGVPALALGTLAAFISATLVIKWLLRYVSKNDFKIFGYYRIALAIIVFITLL